MMSLSDYNNKSNTQMDNCLNHPSPALSENYNRKSVKTFFYFRHANVPKNLGIKCVPTLFMTNLNHISKVKVISFLLGSTVTFLVMASYIMMWDKKVPLFTAMPFELGPVVIQGSRKPTEVSFENSLIDINLRERITSSIQEYTPRKVPEEKDVIGTDSNLFSVFPRQFLPGIKSPCWYEELPAEVSDQFITDLYRTNRFAMFSRGFNRACHQLRANFRQHLTQRDGKSYRLRCLPYFYVIGQPKCGTTDLFRRLLIHPAVKFNTIKEPHWWTRKRFGYIRFKEGSQENYPVEHYLDLFDLAANNILEGLRRNSSEDHRAQQITTGEASVSTMWDNQGWSHLHRDSEDHEPPFLVQDFIHTVQPNARIIIMLRNPVERLYSDYLYFTTADKSAEDFHEKVTVSVKVFQTCLSERSLRSCIYRTSTFKSMPVRLNLGVYFVYILDWLTVFHKEQILVLQLEDYSTNIKATMKRVFDFLRVGPLSEELEAVLVKHPMFNTRRTKDKKLGPMLPATKDLLDKFYQPFNQKLAEVLKNNSFLWSDT
ncbi:unnamed protein product [Menidia menidia]|uniref:Sulfotransferase n=1 Tax=Menidia menidia TaxID=238744 RepID=A0A8S4BU07_9TELE|nr:unnamed protein product [Menidia menidia]